MARDTEGAGDVSGMTKQQLDNLRQLHTVFSHVMLPASEAALAAAIDALGKLPLTADGVLVVPGMELFHPIEGPCEVIIDACQDGLDGGWCCNPTECYLTAAAAESAKGSDV